MDDKERFIAELYEAARQVSTETGAAWQTILAQAAQETGWGKRVLPGTNNIFNTKADKGWHGETRTFNVWEIEDGRKVWKEQPFRVYGSIEEALHDRIEFLRANPRYRRAGLFESEITGHLEREAEALQRAGYATDPNYAANLVRVFNGPTMQRAIASAQRDIPTRHPTATHEPSRRAPQRLGDHGEDVRSTQVALDRLGYRDASGQRLRPDGDFGRRTEEALKAFQRAHGLEPVGHVGPKTQAALVVARRDGPTPVDPAHPDHALQQQVARAVDALEHGLGRKPDAGSRRLKASLLVAAREHGLARVDHVVLSTARDGVQAGQSVFAVQGELDDPASRRVHVATQQALATPAAASYARLAPTEARLPVQPRVEAQAVSAGHGEYGAGLRRFPSP